MEIEKKHTCCFIGHRVMKATEELSKELSDTMENLIVKEKVNTFLFGGKGKFDNLCFDIASTLKQKYPYIQRIRTNVGFPLLDGDFSDDNIEKCYEDVYYPGRKFNTERLIYQGRSEEERINMSGFCIAYYDENNDYPEELLCGFGECTAGVLMEYAKQNGVCMINIAGCR